jgi:hypothetical protein
MERAGLSVIVYVVFRGVPLVVTIRLAPEQPAFALLSSTWIV